MDFLGPMVSMAGRFADYEIARSNANKNRDMQMLAMKKGIQMKVEDAKKAGLHPLAALGAQTYQPAPISMHSDFGGMGQDVSRAVAAGGSNNSRMNELALRNMELRNQLIEGQIARLQQDQLAPAIPLPTSVQAEASSTTGVDFTADPRVAMVKPPSPSVETAKFFGYPLMRNPRLFSSAQTGQNEFGEWWENIAGIPAAIEAFSRAILLRNLRDYERGKEIQRRLR